MPLDRATSAEEDVKVSMAKDVEEDAEKEVDKTEEDATKEIAEEVEAHMKMGLTSNLLPIN